MSKDISKIVRTIKGKDTSSKVSNVMQKIQDRRMAELDNITIERTLQEERKRIDELRKGGNQPQQGAASNFLSQLMANAQVDPAKAKSFLDSLSAEDITKLSMLSSVGPNNNNMMQLLPLLQKKGSDIKDIIAIVKLLQPPAPQPVQQVDYKAIAEIFNSGVKAGGGGGSNNMQVFEKYVQPVLQEVKAVNNQLAVERMNNLQKEINELRGQPGFAQQMMMKKEELKAFAEAFGSGGRTANAEIEMMKIKQDRDIADRKIDLEKWKMQFAAEQNKNDRTYEMIERVLDGPLGKTVQGLGDAAADRFAGGKERRKKNPPNYPPNAVQIKCPGCSKDFVGSSDAKIITCPHCGIQMRPVGQPVPQDENVKSEKSDVEKAKEAVAKENPQGSLGKF